MADPALDVVLLWHMHQPAYQVAGEFVEPWTYLHAIKDYADMAAHLESVPGAKAVMNFTPVLLEQIDAYAEALRRYFADGSPLPDALLASLVSPPPSDPVTRNRLLKRYLSVQARTVLGRFPAYARLASLARAATADADLSRYVHDDLLRDLGVWFHLAWFGEFRRRDDARVQTLAAQGFGFSDEQRRMVLGIIGEELSNLLPRYRALVSRGQVEIAISPWGHPIVPLLLDIKAGAETMPNLPVPNVETYPGGEERARWHLQQALAVCESHFGARPAGVWPSEAAISSPTLALLNEFGFRWCASGGAVLRNASVQFDDEDCVHRSFCVPGQQMRCVFRDDGLSDAIGFNYQSWAADDAVADLLTHLRSIRRACPNPDALVVIALDGENAWEHYPQNGLAFLSTLYSTLSHTDGIRLTTLAEHFSANGVALPLEHVKAGSWVHGTLTTWVGNAERNRAWELLVAAKQVFDGVAPHHPHREQLDRLLGICEGSDWFWWLSEHQSAEAVARFEALYRTQLRALYRAMDVAPPAELDVVLGQGQDGANAGVMQRS